jgi:protocatechuate 3,4-dioxygenase beta subunit
MAGLCLARALPPTETVRGEVVDEKNAPISDAICTLTSRLLPPEGLTATTDRKGQFEFQGLQPAEYTLFCAAAGRQPFKRAL